MLFVVEEEIGRTDKNKKEKKEKRFLKENKIMNFLVKWREDKTRKTKDS